MIAAWIVRAVDIALGAGYLGWLAAWAGLGRRTRRGRDDAASARRLLVRVCRIGAAVGAAALAVGLVATVMKDPPGRMDRLIWPGVVYLGTALLSAVRLRRRPGRPVRTGAGEATA